MRQNLLLASAASLTVALFAAQAHAQTVEPAAAAAPNQVEQIVVTAEKRAENIQNVPLSITAVTGQALQAAGVLTVTDLGKVAPSLQINNTVFGAGVIIRIRGFGSAANTATDSDVASYVDGAFIARPGAILSSLLDVKSVEVLNGPQGTLFGRNAAMGAVSINTNAPSHVQSLTASAEGGSYGTYAGSLIGNLPVNDQLAVRAAIKQSDTSGIYKNNLDGKTYGASDSTVGRISAKWDATSNLSWTLRLDGSSMHGDGAYPPTVDTQTASAAQLTSFSTFIKNFGGSAPVYSNPGAYTFNQYFTNPYERDSQVGITSDIDWTLSPILTARLVDTYRDWNNIQQIGDTIYTSLNLLSVVETTKSHAQSHELQLISSKDAYLDHKLGFTAGVYYFQEDFGLNTNFNVGSQLCTAALTSVGRAVLIPACQAAPQANAAYSVFNQSSTSYAVYGQANYQVLPTVDLSLGARQTWDHKTGSFSDTSLNAFAMGQIATNEGPETLSFTDSKPSVLASLSWHATDHIMPFVTYSTGYKSGGFNSGPASVVLGSASRTFASETVTDVEVGVKSVFWDGRALLNLTAFDTNLSNFQDRSFNGTVFLVRNAGNVRSEGIDTGGQLRPVPSVSLTYAATYLNSIYTSDLNAPGLEGCTGLPGCPLTQNLSGQPIEFAPTWKGNIGAEWKSDPFAGGYRALVAVSENYTDSMLTANTDNPQSRVPGYATTDFHVSFFTPDTRWQFDIFGSNVTNTHYYVSTTAQVLSSIMPGVNNTATGATIFRGSLGDPARFGARLTAKF